MKRDTFLFEDISFSVGGIIPCLFHLLQAFQPHIRMQILSFGRKMDAVGPLPKQVQLIGIRT